MHTSTPLPLLLAVPTVWEMKAVREGVRQFLPGGAVRLGLCGVGPKRAQRFCRSLDGQEGIGRLVLVGWGGGLRPGVPVGSIVVASNVLNENGESAPCYSPAIPNARTGPTLTVSQPLLTPAAKAEAACATPALAVEMEAYPLAVWAATKGIPFAHARLILDGHDESLPDAGDLSLEVEEGPGKLLLRLLGRPRLAIDLLRLSARVSKLNPKLAALARALVESWPA